MVMPIFGTTICITNFVVWCSVEFDYPKYSVTLDVNSVKKEALTLKDHTSVIPDTTMKLAEPKVILEVAPTATTTGVETFRAHLFLVEPALNFLSDVYLCTFLV